MTISKETLENIGAHLYSSTFNNICTAYYSYNGKVYEIVEDKNSNQITVDEVVK